MRKNMTPVLTKPMKQFLELMLETGGPMLKFMDSQKEQLIDVQDLSFKYASNLIASVALGTKIDSFSNPNGEIPQILSKLFKSFRRMLALVSVFFMPDGVDRTGSLLYFRLINSKIISKVFWTAMKKREKSGKERGDFIDFAIKLQNKPPNPLYEFGGDNLLHQAGTFFSGFVSSAVVASFTLMQLARHKNFQEQAREDIRRAVENYGWTYEGFLEMRFLNLCVSEAMRMHPKVPTLDRVGWEDYKIPGSNFTLKKYGLHEDPKHFKDPGTFDPTRFEEGKVIPEAYIPFGAGPRMCPGSKLGLLHAKAVISMILARYEIYQSPEESHTLDARSTFTAATGGLMIKCTELADEDRIKMN